MNHSPPLWQSPPHSTHLTLPNRRRWPCYHHNVDKQWQLSQTEGHFDGSGSNESWLWNKWHISVCSEAYSQDIKRLRPWWDARAPWQKIPRQPGRNEISELELGSRDFTQLTERETLQHFRLWGTLFPSRPLAPQCLSPSHTRILVLFHSKCVSHGFHRLSRLSDPPLPPSPPPPPPPAAASSLSLLSIFGHFQKGCWRKAELTQKESKAVFLGIIGIVWWSTKSQKRRGVSAQDLTLKARILGNCTSLSSSLSTRQHGDFLWS